MNESTLKLSTDDIVKEALSAKMIFIDGGGVTLTGGEVTCQKGAVLNLLNKLKEHGIHTCIETNASLPDCEGIFDTVDYMIADFKSPFEEKIHSIGGDIEIVKNNLIHRAKSGKPLLVRIPLIKFFNCGNEAAEEFAGFFSELSSYGKENLYFEILTYHEFGKDKYEKLNMEYTVTDGYVTQEDVKTLLSALKTKNLKVINT